MSTTSSSTHQRDYDVFLSFRGKDTRHNIVSHLYKALVDRGIRTFKDNRDLEHGDIISDQLVKAINTSWFAVVVLSENYATSSWCLEELRQIMELRSERQIKVVPIFYNVEPSDVRHQRGSFEVAFQRYKDIEKILQWKGALAQVGSLSGKHSRTCTDEATMIVDIIDIISSKLQKMKPADLFNLDNLVGMEAQMVEMNSILNMQSENEVLVIGIWGMGGIGKTTIAKCLYDRFSDRFSACYFIDDIQRIYKDKTPSYLQERFLFSIADVHHIDSHNVDARSQEIKARLGHQKVLLVLDGVDKSEQVRALAKETNWFGPGSRIIITTRDKGLLNFCRVSYVYEVTCLDDEDALQVFETLYYEGGLPPSDGIKKLFIRASRLAHGLPSALVTYASHLREYTTIEEWEDELSILETRPHKNVEAILRNSYNDLNEEDKTTFLHVACLLDGYPFSHVTSLLDDGRPRINHLIAKSLISISSDGYINMHALVLQTGKRIVSQESEILHSRKRFLWDPNEIHNILANNKGMDTTEGMTLHMCEMTDMLSLSNTVFNPMHNLQFLKFFQHLSDINSNVQLRSYDFNFPPNLRLLHRDAYPLGFLPSKFQHDHLVEVNLQYSNLKSLWDKTMNLRNLRRLDVTGSRNLIELPDLSTAKKFEELMVEGCIKLRKIPGSLRSLHRLKKLNAIHCDTLRNIGFIVGFNCNEDEGSWRFTLRFQNEGVQLHYLEDLSIQRQICIELFGLLGKAEHLSFGSKRQIPKSKTMEQETLWAQRMPDSNSSKSLEISRFSYMENRAPFNCSSFKQFFYLTELKLINLNIKSLPIDIEDLQFLEKLELDGNDFRLLFKDLSMLRMVHFPKLKYLSFRNCRKLELVPKFSQVETLILSDCVRLELLPEPNDKTEWIKNCLLELRLDNCTGFLKYSHQLLRYIKLAYLDLSRNDFEVIPESIRDILSLEILFLDNCKKLKSIEDLPLSLKHLYAHGCDSLENVTLSPNHSIKHLDLNHCPHLNRQEHEHLMNLFIYEGPSQKGSRRCVCLPGTGVSGDSDYNPSGSGTSSEINLPECFPLSLLESVFSCFLQISHFLLCPRSVEEEEEAEA